MRAVVLGFCASAASDQATAVLLRNVINSRRFICPLTAAVKTVGNYQLPGTPHRFVHRNGSALATAALGRVVALAAHGSNSLKAATTTISTASTRLPWLPLGTWRLCHPCELNCSRPSTA